MAAQIGTVETLPTTETLRGYYAYNGYGNCAWLRRQAIITGSPYWWERYQACLYY